MFQDLRDPEGCRSVVGKRLIGTHAITAANVHALVFQGQDGRDGYGPSGPKGVKVNFTI